MRHLVVKDFRKRVVARRGEVRRRLFKCFLSNSFFSSQVKQLFQLNLDGRWKNKSVYRVTNRCLITRKSKSIIRFFGLERLVLRDKFLFGSLMGIRRCVW